MSDRFNIDLGEFRIVDLASEYRHRARENAPATIELSIGGVILGSVAFGPAGGVVGATVGSLLGYLKDEGYLDGDDDLGGVRVEVGGDR